RFEVVKLSGLHLPNFPGDHWFATAEFAPESEERPSENFANVAVPFSLQSLKPVEETGDSRQRWIGSREVLSISRLRDRLPKVLQRRNCERALGSIEMIQASFPDAGACAKVLDGDRMITLLPEKIAGGIQEALSCATGASHKCESFSLF